MSLTSSQFISHFTVKFISQYCFAGKQKLFLYRNLKQYLMIHEMSHFNVFFGKVIFSLPSKSKATFSGKEMPSFRMKQEISYFIVFFFWETLIFQTLYERNRVFGSVMKIQSNRNKTEKINSDLLTFFASFMITGAFWRGFINKYFY